MVILASHAGVFRELVFRFSSRTPPQPRTTYTPFPSLANHIVPSKVWKVDLDRRVTAICMKHCKRWTSFFETFPVGPNQSIEVWTEIS